MGGRRQRSLALKFCSGVPTRCKVWKDQIFQLNVDQHRRTHLTWCVHSNPLRGSAEEQHVWEAKQTSLFLDLSGCSNNRTILFFFCFFFPIEQSEGSFDERSKSRLTVMVRMKDVASSRKPEGCGRVSPHHRCFLLGPAELEHHIHDEQPKSHRAGIVLVADARSAPMLLPHLHADNIWMGLLYLL